MEPNEQRGGRKRERPDDESVEERKESPATRLHEQAGGGVPAPAADTFLGRHVTVVNNDSHNLSNSLWHYPAQQPMIAGQFIGHHLTPQMISPLGHPGFANAELLMRQLGGQFGVPHPQFMMAQPGNALLLQLLALQNQAMVQGMGGVPNGAPPFLVGPFANNGMPNQSATPGNNPLPGQSSEAPSGNTSRQPPAAIASSRTQSEPDGDSVPPSPGETGRKPLVLYTDLDEGRLTPYQCLARKHLEYFEADQSRVEEGAQGRNKAIVLGQVGIRCVHCGHLKRKEKSPAAAFYPSKLTGLYQSAQNIINSHLAKTCKEVPEQVRERLLTLGNRKSAPGGGKAYWAEEAMRVGVYEDDNGLRFCTSGQGPPVKQATRPIKKPAAPPAKLEP